MVVRLKTGGDSTNSRVTEITVKPFQFGDFWQALVLANENADALEYSTSLTTIESDAEIAVKLQHRMSAGMLAQHQPVVTTQFRRIHTLIIERVLEQTIDVDTGFVSKGAFPDQALVPGQRSVGGGGDPLRQRREMRELDIDLEAIQFA